jgi:hypothetical protein
VVSATSAPATPADAEAPVFRERRAVPWWWWAVALIFAVPSVEAVVVLGPDMTGRGGWLLALCCLVGTVAVVAWLLIALSRSDVEVDGDGLRAGRDVLAAAAIGRVRPLDRTTTRAVLGRDARADAHLNIRPWVHTAVQIEVVGAPGAGGAPGAAGAAGAAPYWVVGTRRPTELAASLDRLRLHCAGDDLAGAHSPALE